MQGHTDNLERAEPVQPLGGIDFNAIDKENIDGILKNPAFIGGVSILALSYPANVIGFIYPQFDYLRPIASAGVVLGINMACGVLNSEKYKCKAEIDVINNSDNIPESEKEINKNYSDSIRNGRYIVTAASAAVTYLFTNEFFYSLGMLPPAGVSRRVAAASFITSLAISNISYNLEKNRLQQLVEIEVANVPEGEVVLSNYGMPDDSHLEGLRRRSNTGYNQGM